MNSKILYVTQVSGNETNAAPSFLRSQTVADCFNRFLYIFGIREIVMLGQEVRE